MTRLFYEKYVPDDPVLAPVFANIGPDHPERVATWLGEVFGGPKDYSERYGGYDWMVSQHVRKALTEEQRARWAQLMCRCADEAGLPSDPEFRAAFVSYIEWGSRIAVEIRPPERSRPCTCRCRVGRGCATQHQVRVSRLLPHNPERNAP